MLFLVIAVTGFQYKMSLAVTNSSEFWLWFSGGVILEIKLTKATLLLRCSSVIVSWEQSAISGL